MGDPTPLGTAYFFIKFELCVRPFIGIAYGERFVVSISIKTGIKLCVTYIGHIVFANVRFLGFLLYSFHCFRSQQFILSHMHEKLLKQFTSEVSAYNNSEAFDCTRIYRA